MNKIQLDISDGIADTMFISLYARAKQSGEKNPLISDQTACRLVEKIDFDFDKYKDLKVSSVAAAIRASHFDEVTKQFIKVNPNAVIVCIGCGLDTRKQRLGTHAGNAAFYELDIEEVIDARRQIMPPEDNQFYIASSMLTTGWMDEILAKYPEGNFIFIIEGVLMYFSEADVRFVFTELAKRFNGAELHFDAINKWMSKQRSSVQKDEVVFKFGIDNVRELEKWHPDLKFQKSYLMKDFKGWRRIGLGTSLVMSLVSVYRTGARLFSYKIGT